MSAKRATPGSPRALAAARDTAIGDEDLNAARRAIKAASLEVGQRVLLKPDAQPQDRFAIAVWTGDDATQVGFLPSNVAADVMAVSMRDRTGFGGFVAQEVRDAQSKERRDVTIIIGPGVVYAEPTA